jgi:hypothetical protein
MALIGAMIFIVFVLRAEDTRREVVGEGGIRERIIKQEQENPCNDLTTRQCAIKLFRSLSPAERRDIERRIIAEERRIRQRVRRQRGRQLERQRSGSSPSSTGPTASAPAPGQERPTSPQPGGSGGGGEGAGGGTSVQPPSPSIQESDEPLARTPSVTVPQTPVTPPVTVPSLEVPCVELAPLVNC